MHLKSTFFVVLSLSVMFMASCGKQSSKDLAKTFFYPSNTNGYVMLFQDSVNPIFEMFERVSTFSDPWGEHRLIERYNSNFILVESYDILVEKDYKVLNHILYNGPHEIIAHISDSTFMPWSGRATFSSGFPGAVDSLYFTLTNKRSLNEAEGSFTWKEKKLATRIFTDSIFTLAVDLKNKREKTQSTVAYHEFAEGLGRVRIKSADGSFNLVLKSVISDEEWLTLITK